MEGKERRRVGRGMREELRNWKEWRRRLVMKVGRREEKW
jgi:hypothetical protein